MIYFLVINDIYSLCSYKRKAKLENESFQLNIIFMWITRSGNVCLSMKYVFGLFAMFVTSHKSFQQRTFREGKWDWLCSRLASHFTNVNGWFKKRNY